MFYFFHRFLKAFPLLLRQIEGLKMLQEKQENDVRNKINPNKPIAKIKSMPAKTKKADMLDDDDSDNELQVIYLQNIFFEHQNISTWHYFQVEFSCKLFEP